MMGLVIQMTKQRFMASMVNQVPPGWIREDVDNKGQIQVVDLVLISMHYGKTW